MTYVSDNYTSYSAPSRLTLKRDLNLEMFNGFNASAIRQIWAISFYQKDQVTNGKLGPLLIHPQHVTLYKPK